MASSRGPRLLYVLPLLAVAVLGLSTVLGTEGGTVRSAVVLGGPTDGVGPFRGRLQVVEEAHDTATPVGKEPILLTARQGSHRIERRLSTDDGGWTEFELPISGHQPFELTVIDRRGKVLARGSPRLETSRWLAAARRREGDMRLQEKDALSAKLSIEKRVLAVPFAGDGVLVVKSDGAPLSGVQVRLQGRGVEIRGLNSGKTNDEGRFPFVVVPSEHVASLVVSLKGDGFAWDFEQPLPVVPGAFGLKEGSDGFEVLAPVPREEAWYTFVSEGVRYPGGRIDLKEDPSGLFTGKIPRSATPRAEGLFLVLASSADARSPSTVGYPLDGQDHTLDIWDAYLIDGGPAERRRVERRRRKIRFTLGAYAGVSGLLTLLLFILHVKRADRELSVRLERAGASASTREKSPFPLLIAAIGLFFAFSAGVLWIVAR